MSRFDYVKYDAQAIDQQNNLKELVTNCETALNGLECRAKSLAITKLEEFYMWAGKAIRDDQIARNGYAELQVERKNG